MPVEDKDPNITLCTIVSASRAQMTDLKHLVIRNLRVGKNGCLEIHENPSGLVLQLSCRGFLDLEK